MTIIQPDHPDFAELAAIERQLDGESRLHGFAHIIASTAIDRESLLYVADQRALRAAKILGIESSSVRAMLQALYLNGWLAGQRFEHGRP